LPLGPCGLTLLEGKIDLSYDVRLIRNPAVAAMNLSQLPRRPNRHLLFALLACAIGMPALPALAQGNAKASGYYEDALTRYDKKDISGAIIQLKNALQIDPNLLPVQLLLGKALMQSGEVAAAEVAFNEALRLGVNRAEVVVSLGQAYVAQGKQAQFLANNTFAVAGLPPGIQLKMHLLRAAAQADIGEADAALRSVDEARAIDKRNVDAWLAEVPIRIRARQFKEAAIAIDAALALTPDSAEARYQKGALAHVQGDLRTALDAYDLALLADKRHVEARVARIGIAMDQGRYTDAAKAIEELQSVAPDEPRGAYMKALLADRNGDREGSLAGLKQVTELLDPVPIDFIRYRPQLLMLNGLAHFGLRQTEKAKQYLEAFQRVQRNSPVSKLLARIYMTDGNYAMAIDLLESYLRVQPGDGQALTLLANAHMAAGRNAKATALMQEALKSKDSPAFRTTLGLSLIGDGQTANGIAELESAYRKDPRQRQAAVALGHLYLQTNQARKAIPVAEQLVKLQGNNAQYQNLLGMALGQSGNVAGARMAFEKAIAINPNLHQAKLNLVKVDIATSAYAAATARLSDLLKAVPNFPEALYELAVIAERKGQPADAQRWLEKARDVAGSGDTRWDLALMELHLRHDRPSLALDAAKSASAKKPDDLQVLLSYSRAQLANGDTVAAKTALNRATRFAEYDAPSQVQIAGLQMAANNPAGAAYSLEKGLSGRPDFLPALAMMAQVEMRQGEFDKADKRARDIIAQHPKLDIGYSLQGEVALARNQPSGAIDAFRKAHQIAPSTASLIRLFRAMSGQDDGKPALSLAEQWLKTHPQDVSVQKALADGYARAGEFKSAKLAYETALKLNSDDAEALNNLANIQLRLGDPAAIKTAEMALTHSPGNPLVIDTLGWALLQNGQTDRALQLLRDARLRQPGNPEIRFHLAVALAKTGRNSEARQELEVAVKNVNGFESIKEAKQLLESIR
jgi:cellulose synthase operon protein C